MTPIGIQNNHLIYAILTKHDLLDSNYRIPMEINIQTGRVIFVYMTKDECYDLISRLEGYSSALDFIINNLQIAIEHEYYRVRDVKFFRFDNPDDINSFNIDKDE